jgi:hypothetical protein
MPIFNSTGNVQDAQTPHFSTIQLPALKSNIEKIPSEAHIEIEIRSMFRALCVGLVPLDFPTETSVSMLKHLK